MKSKRDQKLKKAEKARQLKQKAKRNNIFSLITGGICILLGIFMLTLPFMHAVPYEEYIEKELVIEKIGHQSGGLRRAFYDYIITEEGEKFNIAGEYNRSELLEVLSKGTTAKIKYYTNTILPFKQYVEEIFVNDVQIVTYNGPPSVDWVIPILFCFLLCILGLAPFAYKLFINKRKKKKQSEVGNHSHN